MKQIVSNKTLDTSIVAWFAAQFLKVLFVLVKDKKFDFSRFVGSGGMPSSHSSFVVALSVSVGKICGFESSEFAIAVVFAFIVMYDAAGVRRAAGKQARVLNKIVKEMQDTGKIPEEKLKELIGHTPVEVLGGALVGLIVAIVM
jgi:hypothetical protein